MELLTGSDLRELTRLRLDEAEILLKAGKSEGCVYLCGYVVELALKAIICRTLSIDEYPKVNVFKTHDLDILVLLAGLQEQVNSFSGELKGNWSLVTTWNSAFRYSRLGSYTQSIAETWIAALKDPTHGVLTWLETKW